MNSTARVGFLLQPKVHKMTSIIACCNRFILLELRQLVLGV